MKICTIQDGVKMLRPVNPFSKTVYEIDGTVDIVGSMYNTKAYDNFEKEVAYHPCDIPDLNEGDTIEDSECELQFQVWHETKGWIKADPEYKWHAHLRNRQAYVRKEPVRDREQNLIKVIDDLYTKYVLIEDDRAYMTKDLFRLALQDFVKQGFTITKKI